MVVVYTNEGCQPCRAVKRFLKTNGVPFEEKSVTDSNNLEVVKGLGYGSVPVIVTKTGEHFDGYQPDRLASLK